MEYQVDVKEVWTNTYFVEASSKEEALQKVNNLIEAGESGDEFEYSDTRDIDEWTVVNLTKDKIE